MQKSYFAAIWAGLYAIACLVWSLTGGYPAGTGDIENSLNPIRTIPAGTLAPIAAVLALATAVMAFAISGRYSAKLHGVPRKAVLAFGWLMVALLLFVVPDIRLLMLAGYAPMLLIGGPLGMFDGKLEISSLFNLPLFHQMWCVLGGILLARTLLAWQRGTSTVESGQTDRIVRWGRVAAYVAAIIPSLYAVSRFAWLLGIPLGVSTEGLRELRESGAVWAGAGLGAFAVVGSILTLGLVQPWGTRMFGWRVPINLAFVPATLVAIIVMQASISFLSSLEMRELIGTTSFTVVPMAIWPLWSVGLFVAAVAYKRRRLAAA
ncbi:hypothetical protein [Catelliglobosispora koreensis]|uniref:hypothetical protein n=1 Tax=Catelliglobosispora koreensis TaxID=129052 RepID=UPI000373164C|nr:hypothetical protein [Catelliglobosispora koreensis]